MVKLLFRKSDILKLSATSIVCSLLSVFIQGAFRSGAVNLEEAFLITRDGYIVLANGDYHSDAFTCTFSMILFFFLITSIFSQDIEMAKAFVLHRAKNNNRWFYLKYLQSGAYCFYACIVYHIAIMLLLILLGCKADDIYTVLLYVLWGAATQALVLGMYITLYSVISLFVKPHLASIAAAAFLVICIAMFFVIDVKHIQYYLLTSYFISWHLSFSENSINYTFPVWTYYAAMCLIIAIELIVANKIIKKKDFI